jgi:hypothetical protein
MTVERDTALLLVMEGDTPSPKKIYIERRPSFFAFAGIGTKMKKMRGILR